MSLTVKNLVADAYANSKAKGFHDQPRNVGEALALIHSEISEALEEARKGKNVTEIRYEDNKPEGFGVELADAVIRIADLCGSLGIDLEEAILLKMNYNKNRPYLHGKKF